MWNFESNSTHLNFFQFKSDLVRNYEISTLNHTYSLRDAAVMAFKMELMTITYEFVAEKMTD